MGLVLLVAAALAAAQPSTRPSTAPAEDGLQARALQAIDADDLDSLREAAEAQLNTILPDLGKLQAEQVVRLCAYRELALYFGKAGQVGPADRDTLKWLISRPRLFPTLMMAVSADDPPAKVLGVLTKLRADQGNRLDEYPDLTAAFCVVWDTQTIGTSADRHNDVDRAVRLFRFFVGARERMVFRPDDLPYPLAIFLVDVQVTDEEIAWTLNKYKAHRSIGGVYFDVPYDEAAYYEGKSKVISGHKYTLENLNRHGGVCIDQAYYASQVGKILGIPTAVATGQGGGGGVGHAWLGFLQVVGRVVLWDFEEGRYDEHLYWVGNVRDPQTGRRITDADVALLAELQRSGPADRLFSVALWKLRDLVRDSQRADLLRKAIDLSPGNRAAWLSLADMGAQRKLSPQQMNQVVAILQKFAVRRYGDFAFEMCRRMVAGQEPAEQLAAMERATGIFWDRPDLLAKIRLEQADLLMALNRRDDAMRAYGDVLTNRLDAGPIILQAMDKVDGLLRQSKELPRLTAIYDQVWKRMPMPDESAFVTGTPWYLVGQKYAKLLDELGEAASAEGVRQRLRTMNTATGVRR